MRPHIARSGEKRSHSTAQYLVLFGLVIALPLLVMLGALLLRSASIEREQLDQRILQVLGALTDNLDRDLDRHLTILHTLATSAALQGEDWPAFYEQAKAALQGRSYIVLVDAAGRQLVNTNLPYGQAPSFTGDPETVRRIAESRRPVVSNLFTGLAARKPALNVSIPILRDGQLRFVMSLGLDPHDLVSLLAAQKLDHHWVLTIWDARDVILARSRDNERYFGGPLPENLRVSAGPSGVVRTRNIDGEDVLHAATRSDVSGWGVGVNIPLSFVEQQSESSLWLLGGMSIFAVASATGLGVLFARQLTMPLAAASTAAIAMGRGYPFKISASRLKEANTFNQALEGAQRELAQRTAALRESEAQKTAILELALDAIVAMDRDGRIVDFNAEAERLFGFSRDAIIGRPLAEMIIPERFRDAHRRGLRRFLETGQGTIVGRRIEMPALRADGTEFDSELAIAATRQNGGQILFTACLRDITERNRAAKAEEMLLRELQHRTGNLLAVVQAIARISLSGAGSLDEAKTAFEARLQALARAHRHLTESNWRGVNLSDLVHEALEPFVVQTTIDGPSVIVGAQQAQNFSLAIYELATNAIKYGALSNATGKVSVSWAVNADGETPSLNFKWQERGGPPVIPPTRRGFGSSLLRATFDRIKVDYASEGLSCEIQVPLARVDANVSPPVIVAPLEKGIAASGERTDSTAL